MFSLKKYPETTQERLILLFIFFAAAGLFLTRLGHFPFKDYDEATYALVSAEMVESGYYIHFTHDRSPWIDKPPLLFWLIGGSVHILGFNEFALRLPEALIGIASIFLTYAFARSLTNNKTVAFLSACILLTTSQFVYSAREVRFDVPVSCAILFALYSFFRGWQKPLWYAGMGISIAAAILFKSTFVVFIPILILIFSFTYHEWKWLKQPSFWLSIFGGLLLAAPWHIAQYHTYGSAFLQTYLGLNGLRRYTDPFLGGANASPIYFFRIATKLIEPWFAVFSLGLLWVVVQRKKLRTWKWYQPLAATLLSVMVIVGFLSFSKSKLFYYFDPIYPFFAIFIGLLFMLWREKTSWSSKKISITITCLLLLGLANTLWQITEFRSWPVGGEYGVAEDEREVSAILNKQTESAKLYTLFHPLWDTIHFYTRKRAEPIQFDTFTKGTADSSAFFLLIPTADLEVVEMGPALSARLETAFNGKQLTLFKARAIKAI